ncbi:MAG TPA: hypothetical protein VHF67_02230 [Gaiellaceae bacterium]|nr:hypothetical protein [Gaiellaceae bacterium]
MGADTAILLVGFGLMKVGIAAAIVWLGVRSAERPDDGEGFGDGGPSGAPPLFPARRRRRRPPERHRPARSPSRPGRRVRA